MRQPLTRPLSVQNLQLVGRCIYEGRIHFDPLDNKVLISVNPEHERQFLIGGGKSGELIRRHDWSATSIGIPERWPAALRNALELMLSSCDSMYLVWGPELLFFCNDAYRSVQEMRLNDAVGTPFPILLENVWSSVQGSMTEAFAGRANRLTDIPSITVRGGAEATTWWSYSFSPIRNDAGSIKGVLCFAKDTTDYVKATLALMDSEQRLDALIKSSSEVRFSISADWSQLHQLTGGDFIPNTDDTNSKWLEEYIPADARDAVRREYERAIQTRTTYHIEHPVNQVDGTVGWAHVRAVPLINQHGVISGWLGAASNITDRKRAETALLESEAQLRILNSNLESIITERTAKLRLFRDVIEANAVPTCVFDTNFRQIAFNRAHLDVFEQLHGVRPKDGEILPNLLPPAQEARLHAHMARALDGETFRVIAEFGEKGINQRSFDFSYTPLLDSTGAVIGAFYFAHDITEEIKSRVELEAAQSALRQAQKLEAVGQLTGGVAHDFNNLLTVIKSCSDLLKRPTISEDKRQRYADAISSTVDRASRLTGQLLAFARRQTLRPKVFGAGESIKALEDMFETLSGSTMAILMEISEKPCFIFADANQFDTALVNLVLNARDAMGGSGQICIRVEPTDHIFANGGKPASTGQYVVVAVTDTGSGISSDILESIFEPFFTTKEQGKGTGLGLSQVFGFAKQSGGEILVESQVGEGTTFRLFLPRVDAQANAQLNKNSEHETLNADHGTWILVVEDNPDVGTLCLNILSELGFRPVLASSAENALEQLSHGEDRFAVVLTDVVMPGMNGIDLAKAIRRSHPLLPVVLTSGYSDILAQEGSFGFEVLRKPYSIDELSSVLVNALRSIHSHYDE
ncbi:PAS/PAC sensor hybrid histidine kinase [Pseudomonas fluorescens]|uniref:histidine kinase n=1 Tax=Pseudomonas fluorescens TaxID=294 RepID=A0A448DYS2_PSEFL|nr:PAS domain-containing protein [Pseudomonas fluorescens]VEF11927.1 PAS/PAC sensor hybrid histidine kinase [Pseudomonas fluorescens]